MTRTPRLLLWAATPVAALLVLAAAGQSASPLFMVNESPSLPEGVYVRHGSAPIARGDVVAIDQPAVARPYLARLGMPSGTGLLKRVAAVAGDRVCAVPGGVEVAGARTPVRGEDRAGQPLPRWTGCRVLEPEELFLLGDTASSFDSRYFGPVRRSTASGPYRELLLW